MIKQHCIYCGIPSIIPKRRRRTSPLESLKNFVAQDVKKDLIIFHSYSQAKAIIITTEVLLIGLSTQHPPFGGQNIISIKIANFGLEMLYNLLTVQHICINVECFIAAQGLPSNLFACQWDKPPTTIIYSPEFPLSKSGQFPVLE